MVLTPPFAVCSPNKTSPELSSSVPRLRRVQSVLLQLNYIILILFIGNLFCIALFNWSVLHQKGCFNGSENYDYAKTNVLAVGSVVTEVSFSDLGIFAVDRFYFFLFGRALHLYSTWPSCESS